MYMNMDYWKTIDYYKTKGFSCEKVKHLRLAEYSQQERKTFQFDAFTAVMSGLSEVDKRQVFSIADAFGYYLIPILELNPDHPSNESGVKESVLAWIPTDLLKTVASYLEDLEKWVKASYDYTQEAEGAVRLSADLEMARGYVEHFEQGWTQLNADIFHAQADECPLLLLHHFRGDSRNTFVGLVQLIRKLELQWNSRCPQWKTWKEALDTEWHVGEDTNSPLENFRVIVRAMQTKADELNQVTTPTIL